MALLPRGLGLVNMLKDGSKHMSGLEEAVYRNIQAVKALAQTTKTAFGPRGLNKMIVNNIEKLFVTNDAATIIRELEVEHPAAKMIVFASQMQEKEIGDGTNFVIVFAGALLQHAEDLLRVGLSPSEVIEGYEMALKKALEILPTLTCFEIKDVKDVEQVTKGLRSAIMSKQFGNEDFLSKLISKACTSVLNERDSTFNVDHVRVCKILGSGLDSSEVLQGMVFTREVENDFSKKADAKIAAYTCAFDTMQTETKGTVLIHTAQELKDFSKGEEDLLEKQIKSISDAGVNVVVSGGKYGDMALHYLNKYNIMAVRLNSKWDLRRLCRSVGATALPRVTAPTKDELGLCDTVYVDELGDTSVIVFKQGGNESRITTVVVRGSTQNLMDDVERAIDDGVNTFKGITRDGRFLPGAGATEIELAKQISAYGETIPGLEQYAIRKFAEALENIPKALAENAGMKATEVIAKLYASHQEGNKNIGVDIEAGEDVAVTDAEKSSILDLYLTKFWGLKLAVNSACTVLRVDQIFMAKPAGGPKQRDNKNVDDD